MRELIDMAKGYTDDECSEYLDKMTKCTVGLDKTPDNNRKDFARLCKAYKEYVDENNIGALSSRCWPDFFTAFGTPVCGVLAMLNDMGVAASCEADTYGALSMYMGMKLSEQAVFSEIRCLLMRVKIQLHSGIAEQLHALSQERTQVQQSECIRTERLAL